jgi:hypothetical protein
MLKVGISRLAGKSGGAMIIAFLMPGVKGRCAAFHPGQMRLDRSVVNTLQYYCLGFSPSLTETMWL